MKYRKKVVYSKIRNMARKITRKCDEETKTYNL